MIQPSLWTRIWTGTWRKEPAKTSGLTLRDFQGFNIVAQKRRHETGVFRGMQIAHVEILQFYLLAGELARYLEEMCNPGAGEKRLISEAADQFRINAARPRSGLAEKGTPTPF